MNPACEGGGRMSKYRWKLMGLALAVVLVLGFQCPGTGLL